jgi:N-methylhydantoinase A
VYAHADSSVKVEIVDLRLMIAGTMPKPVFPELAVADAPGPAPARGSRVLLGRLGAEAVAVWRRTDLRAGHTISGPGLVDQDDTTVHLPAGWTGRVSRSGNLLLERRT